MDWAIKMWNTSYVANMRKAKTDGLLPLDIKWHVVLKLFKQNQARTNNLLTWSCGYGPQHLFGVSHDQFDIGWLVFVAGICGRYVASSLG